MEDLIKALTILLKYNPPRCPTSCEHDVLYVHVSPRKVSEADKAALRDLGFAPDDSLGCFRSYRYGSA